MLKSDQDDRKRQWLKLLWRSLARAMVRPETWKMLARVGICIARAIWLFYRVIIFMQE